MTAEPLTPNSPATSLLSALNDIVGPEGLLHSEDELLVNECGRCVVEKRRVRAPGDD